MSRSWRGTAKVVQHEAYGTRGLETADAMPVDALFDMASMTKPVTVAAALMLLEEGRYTLSDPVWNYLPEFKSAKVEAAPGSLTPTARPITVGHLFTHTSGVFDPRSRAEQFVFPTLAAYVRGYLVQQVSGVPLDRFVQERIWIRWGWPTLTTGHRRRKTSAARCSW